MKVTQVYEIMNSITNELLGESVVVNEDLSNIVDIGKSFEDTVGLDSYVRKLPDHIGKVIFVDRVYEGRAPQVLKDGWEFGSIMEKIAARLPEAVENEDWELQDGQSYDPNIFHKPDVYAKFYNDRVTFEIDMSITEDQVKSSFDNATQLNAFLSMIQTAIENSLTVKLDSLIMRTINNMIGETIHDDYGSAQLSSKSGVKAVNLLYLYNQKLGAGNEITADEAITDPGFIRFASMTMANYMDRLKVMSNLFNVGGESRFTPKSMLHVAMLSEFKNAAGSYLQSDTFHNEYTALPNADSIPYFQGPGLSYAFSDTSSINVKTSSGDTVEASGILAVMWDRDALGVANLSRKTPVHYNEKAGFWNYFNKILVGFFNDLNENFCVFFVA